jgi:transposase
MASEGDPWVRHHANAKLTLAGRRLLVERVLEQGWTVRRAAAAAGVSVRTVYKWLARYRAEGCGGLADRNSRPHRCPLRTPGAVVRRIEQLRRRGRRTAWEIADELRVPPSTVSRVLRRLGLGKLWRVEAAT